MIVGPVALAGSYLEFEAGPKEDCSPMGGVLLIGDGEAFLSTSARPFISAALTTLFPTVMG